VAANEGSCPPAARPADRPNARYSAPIVGDHQQAMARLQAQSGTAFDRAYLDRQVEAHRGALRTIDNLLSSLRAGGSSETVAMVEGMRGAVTRHLQNALQLQASLR
jgi:putative membrane protein